VGETGNAGQTAYSASKAGLVGFTRSLAKELAPRRIRANVIAPGFVDTDMLAGLSTEQRAGALAAVPLGRFGTPEDVAEALEYLVRAQYVTGQVLVVDGGLGM
jgi:NAD(P)-dependent dehydrogenase (short-subunit alcohol dehydrogenase family)